LFATTASNMLDGTLAIKGVRKGGVWG